jgi:sigma-B regulation protein RsbU (phosphoserine phosphatase)
MEKRRMESELRAASEVQRVLLPNKPPSLPGFNITARNVAARIVSGDYYDFIPINDDQLGVVIADVSGKGIPASLIMATCRGLLRGMARSVTSPSEALALVNRAIYHDMREDMFISVAYCMLQPNGNEVRLSRAGHDAPFLYTKATSKITRLEPPGLAMGVDEGPVFERVTQDYTFSMEPGDCLLLFTDGVNEAEDSSGEEFGLRRLENTFSLAAGYGAHAVMDAIRVAVQAHMGKHAQADDITMIVIERT